MVADSFCLRKNKRNKQSKNAKDFLPLSVHSVTDGRKSLQSQTQKNTSRFGKNTAESLLFGLADGVSEGMDGSRVVGVSEDGGFPLTTQKEGRVMLLKGYGNAIVPQVAAAFVAAFCEANNEVNHE